MDRVFNKDGGIATDGTPLGEYKSWSVLDKRRNKNFTNILKNLYSNGDMFNSIVTGLKGDQLGLGFNNKEIAEIARHQENSENQVDKDIFYPTMFAAIVYAPGASLFILPLPVPIPAPLFALGYLGYSMWAARQGRGRINHDAHLSGALAGLAFVVLTDPAPFGRALQQVLG